VTGGSASWPAPIKRRHEVDEPALHVRRHQLDADLLTHLEPRGPDSSRPSAGGAKMRTRRPDLELPVTNGVVLLADMGFEKQRGF
jgi:hypothetical protein